MKIKLGELADIMTGNTPSMKVNEYYDSNDIPFIKPDSFISHFELKANSYISNKAERKARIVGANCILVSCIGIIGKVGITSQKVALNQQINSLNVKPRYDIEYIAYNLLFNKERLQRICNSAVVPLINKTQFSNFEISINKDIIIQRDIKNKLNLLSSIINNNKKKLLLLDDIVKSRFVEIFGVFNINPNNYNTIKFRDLIEQTYINEEDMVWLLNLDMIKPNTGEIVEKVYIDRQNIPTSSISFKKGTVLYSKLRPYLNKVVIADEHGYGTSELIPLNSYKNGLTAEYLAYYLRQDSFVEYIKDKVTGAKMPRVAMDILRNIDIIQPNYIYQEQFSSFVNHIDKLKSDVQKSIDETQLLMDSLMQEYFG